MRPALVMGLLLAICPSRVSAQSEAVLRDYFEGRSVILKQPVAAGRECDGGQPGNTRQRKETLNLQTVEYSTAVGRITGLRRGRTGPLHDHFRIGAAGSVTGIDTAPKRSPGARA